MDLTKITKGRLKRAPRVVIYSFPGVGKTSWAAGAPNPFFLDANKGSAAFDVQRIFYDDWMETYELLRSIENEQIKCDTVVLETVGDLEAMSHAHLFQGTSVTKYEGGYGKGDVVVIIEWRKLLSHLERLWDKGKGIIITSHARVKHFESPLGGGYDRYEMACRAPLAGLLAQWSDYTFFAQVQEGVVNEKNKPGKGTTTGERFTYTRRCPAFDAKARGTALFPERLELSYLAFARAVENDNVRIEDMKKEIDAMVSEIGDAKLTKEVAEYLKRYPTQIAEAHNRVKIRLAEKRGAEESTAAPSAAPQQPVATA